MVGNGENIWQIKKRKKGRVLNDSPTICSGFSLGLPRKLDSSRLMDQASSCNMSIPSGEDARPHSVEELGEQNIPLGVADTHIVEVAVDRRTLQRVADNRRQAVSVLNNLLKEADRRW